MGENESLESDGELDIARAHHVLDLEVFELCRKSQLLDDSCVLPGREPGVFFRLGASANHFSRAKDERSGPGKMVEGSTIARALTVNFCKFRRNFVRDHSKP